MKVAVTKMAFLAAFAQICLLLLQPTLLVLVSADPVPTSFRLSSTDGEELLSDAIHKMRRLDDGVINQPESIHLEFQFEGNVFSNKLVRSEGAFTKSATMTISTGDESVVTEPVPETFSYYSTEKDWVMSFRSHTSFEGLHYSDDGRAMYFEFDQGKFYVDDNAHEYFSNSAFSLPQKNKHGRSLEVEYWSNCYTGQGKINTFSIGFASGAALTETIGSDADIITFANSMITLSNEIYTAQMDIKIVIDDFFIQRGSGGPSWSSPSCSLSLQSQLNEMQNWNSRPSKQGLWHLIDDCYDPDKRTPLGIAKLDALCRSDINVGATNYRVNRELEQTYPTWSTVAHELGHNFGARHSFEEGQARTGGIMDYGPLEDKKINGSPQFNTLYRKREVCGEISRVINTCSAFGTGSPSPSPNPVPTPSPTPFPTPQNSVQIGDCRRYSGYIFYPRGPDLFSGTFNEWTTDSCFDLCATTPGCKSFTASDYTRYCELWSDIRGTGNLYRYTRGGYSTYICPFASEKAEPVEGQVFEPRELNCQRNRNMAIAGVPDVYQGSYNDFWTAEECELACAKSKECEAFTFSESSEFCELWSSKTQNDLVEAPFFDTYICSSKTSIVGDSSSTQRVDDLVDQFDSNRLASCCTQHHNVYFLGTNLFVSEKLSQQACLNKCIGTSLCTAFTYTEEQKRCELFESSDSIVPQIGSYAEICQRDCIAGIVYAKSASEEEKANMENPTIMAFAIFGGALVGFLAAAGIFTYKRHRSNKEAEIFKRNAGSISSTDANFDSEVSSDENEETISIPVPEPEIESTEVPVKAPELYPTNTDTSLSSGPPPRRPQRPPRRARPNKNI